MRKIVLRLAADPVWIPDLADELAGAIHGELSELERHADLREATRASCHSVIQLFVETVRFGGDLDRVEPPPAAVGYAREFVRRGVSIETLLRAYHVAHAAFFERWSDQLHAEIAEPDELSVAIEAGATAAFTFVNVLSRGLVERYAAERELWARSAAAIRAEELAALLGDPKRDIERASARLGYELRRRHLGFVIWGFERERGGFDLATLERLAAELEVGLGPKLLVPVGQLTIAGWVALGEGRPALDRLSAPGGVFLAFGEPGNGVEGFRRTHREAQRAAQVARWGGEPAVTAEAAAVTLYRDVELVSLASADPDQARHFVRSRLGPLAAADDRSRTLALTLRVFLEERASPRHAARRLGVHENTIANRVAAARAMLDRPLEDEVAELLVALRLAPLLGTADRAIGSGDGPGP